MGYLLKHFRVRYEPVYTGVQVTCACGCECIDVPSAYHLNSTYTTEQAMSQQNNQNKLNFSIIKSTSQACGIIEGFEPIPQGLTYDQAYIQAYQYLIDTGVVWQLQGMYGRTARGLIDSGYCFPPKS